MSRDEKDVSEEFPELFHYTSVSAFENINKTRQFWVTHYQDLNDTTEFTRFRLRLCEFIRPTIRDIFERQMERHSQFADGVKAYGGIEVVLDNEVEDFLSTVHGRTFAKEMYKDTFVCSFCGHQKPYEAAHGLLSQWRGYGAEGGVAVVLDTPALEQMMRDYYEHLAQLQLLYLATVEYDSLGEESDTKLKKRFKTVFEVLPEIAERWYPKNELYENEELASLFTRIHDEFVLGSTLVKHHAFHEENEIRVVVSPKSEESYNQFQASDTRSRRETLYRPVRGREVRYIELLGSVSLPIKRIIVGPSKIQNSNYQRIRSAVEASVEVVRSEIPFTG